MKILHLSTRQNWGGGEQQLFYLMDQLQGLHHTQMLCSANNHEIIRRITNRGNIQFKIFEKSYFYLSWIFFLLRINHSDFAVIHTHDSRALSIAVIANFFRRQKISIVSHKRFASGQEKTWLSRVKYRQKCIKKIICISSYVYNDCLRYISPQKLTLIPSAIDISRFSKAVDIEQVKQGLNVGLESYLIVSVGSLTSQKKQENFIKIAHRLLASSKLKNIQLHFLILGDGPNQQSYQQLIDHLAIGRHVELIGFSHEVTAILQSSDLLISTSTHEAFGNVIMEAFASKTAVIAARSGGVSDLIKHEKTGILVDDDDIDSFVSNAEKIILDKEFSHFLRVNSLQFVKKFSVEQLGVRINSLYQSVEISG